MPVFAGFLFALGSMQASRGRFPDAGVDAASTRSACAPIRPRDPDALCARDLRRLPRIGPARAIAIVRARFEQGLVGGPEAWIAIGGIGAETVRAVREELQRDGSARLPPPPKGAYTPPGSRP